MASLCFVHCIAGPALLAFAGLSSLVAISERAEILFLLASATIGVAVLFPAYKRRHGRRSCLMIFCSGIAVLLAHRRVSGSVLELATALIGAFLVATAHVLNIRYSSQCPCCRTAPELRGESEVNQ